MLKRALLLFITSCILGYCVGIALAVSPLPGVLGALALVYNLFLGNKDLTERAQLNG